MQIILDSWEGSGDIDEPTLVDNNCAGIITRLNDMHLGHHMDANFERQWDQNRAFQLQSFYFVYNPWVPGLANWQWLQPRIPSDCPPRIFIDVEVIYKGYTPDKYAHEVADFLNRCKTTGYKPCVYTGGWFLPNLAPWPVTDYWWARYPYSVYPTVTPHTWDALKAKLAKLDFATADLVIKHVSPGPVRLWQVSGDKWILPGCAGHAMDISIYPGTLNELKTWWGVPVTEPTLSDHDMTIRLWNAHPEIH